MSDNTLVGKKEIVSQQLLDLRTLINKAFVRMTNTVQADGYKFRYKWEWVKGTNYIERVDGKKTKSYYTFRIYMEDFTHEVKEILDTDGSVLVEGVKPIRSVLYAYHVPYDITVLNKSRMEQEALLGFLEYSISAGVSTQYALYLDMQEKMKEGQNPDKR